MAPAWYFLELKGNEVINFIVEGYSKKWHLRTQHLSQCYTTRIDQPRYKFGYKSVSFTRLSHG